jgi:hypothetical protein
MHAAQGIGRIALLHDAADSSPAVGCRSCSTYVLLLWTSHGFQAQRMSHKSSSVLRQTWLGAVKNVGAPNHLQQTWLGPVGNGQTPNHLQQQRPVLAKQVLPGKCSMLIEPGGRVGALTAGADMVSVCLQEPELQSARLPPPSPKRRRTLSNVAQVSCSTGGESPSDLRSCMACSGNISGGITGSWTRTCVS